MIHPGPAIRRIRIAKGMKATELANEIGSGVGNVSRVERGKQGYTGETLSKIAAALGVAVADFFQSDPLCGDLDEPSKIGARQPVDQRQYQSQQLPTVPLHNLESLSMDADIETLTPVGVIPTPIAFAEGQAFAVTWHGQSMASEVPDGSFIVIDRTAERKPGKSLVLARRGEAVLCRKLMRDGNTLRLEPTEPGYRAEELTSEWEVLGVVRFVTRMLE